MVQYIKASKIPFAKWGSICSNSSKGGLDLSSLFDTNMALRGTVIWRIYKENMRQWARILFDKYRTADDPNLNFIAVALPPGSPLWDHKK